MDYGNLDERVKDFSKVLVTVPVSSIDATVLVIKLHRTGNCLKKETMMKFLLKVLT